MKTYKIIRFVFNGKNKIIKTGLSLEEARSHCNDPETSSSTAKSKKSLKITEEFGMWFDGFEEE